jgi:hypothetical protein
MLQNLLIDQAKATASTILGSIRALTLQLESVITGTKAEEEPMYSALGVIARPKSPVTTASGVALKGECEVLAVKNDDGMQPFAYKDLRIHARCPSPAEGDIFLAGYQGGYVSIRAATGTLGDVVKMYAPRLNSSGVETAAHYLLLDPHSSASPAIALVHGGGYSIRITNAGDTEVRNKLVVAPDSAQQGVMLSTEMLTWITQVNAAFTAIQAAAGLNPNPSITVPTAAPAASSKLTAAL